MQKTQDIYSKLGANERALVDKIRNNTLKSIFIGVIGLKLKLQWKGWLQYLIPIPVILVLLLIAFITYLLEALFFSDYKMNQPIDIHNNPYRIFERTYESCQYAPSSYNGQTTRAVVISDDIVIQRIDFFAITSSKYYAAVASGIWCANWEMGCEELEIKGEFKRPDANEIDLTTEQQRKGVPVYDMSWVFQTRP